MDTLLIAVTGLALAMAAAMAVVAATLLRQERARSQARVAALGALAGELVENTPQQRPAAAVLPPVVEVAPLRVEAAPLRAMVTRPIDDLEIRPSISGASSLFAEPERSSPWGPRFAIIGCLAAIVLAIGLALSFSSRRAASDAASVTATPPASTSEVAPLELMSLRHEQDAQRLVISGVVQNPRAAAPLTHVVATVFVFGPNGAFLSSSRAPLDFTTLTPGQESSFVVSVPVVGQVARYRVGFRTEDGRVLPHVDKRTPDALAQK